MKSFIISMSQALIVCLCFPPMFICTILLSIVKGGKELVERLEKLK